jgi:hypothetical protein
LWGTEEKTKPVNNDVFMGRGKTFVGTPFYVSPGQILIFFFFFFLKKKKNLFLNAKNVCVNCCKCFVGLGVRIIFFMFWLPSI